MRGAAGVALLPWRHFGFYLEGNVTYAPTVDDLIGDTHDSGGLGLLLGLRGGL